MAYWVNWICWNSLPSRPPGHRAKCSKYMTAERPKIKAFCYNEGEVKLIVGATRGRGVTSRRVKPAGSHFPRLFS